MSGESATGSRTGNRFTGRRAFGAVWTVLVLVAVVRIGGIG